MIYRDLFLERSSAMILYGILSEQVKLKVFQELYIENINQLEQEVENPKSSSKIYNLCKGPL